MAVGTHVQAPRAPDRAVSEDLEARWGEAWEGQGTYAFDRSAMREQVYSINIPPPTMSGFLHIGYVFSYTRTDVVACCQRMTGRSMFYPMGWDGNGLPTERRVQNYFDVHADATLPYDLGFKPPHVSDDDKSIKARNQEPILHKNFVGLCERLAQEDEARSETLWRYLNLNVDWKQNYQTIGARARKAAQAVSLCNLARGEAYRTETPGLWDVTFQTAAAQAELESREYPGLYHRLALHITSAETAAKTAVTGAPVEDGTDVYIGTTRPELLAACVALIAHSDGECYKPLLGTTIVSPVYGIEVPILPHPEAEMDKGVGIAMYCIFGDTTDIDWWRDLELPPRATLRKDGHIIAETFRRITTDTGCMAFEEITDKTTFSTREVVVATLRESDELKGEPIKTMRQTNFFEKGDEPLEIVTPHQWYIRNGGRVQTNPTLSKGLNEELIGCDRELEFRPDFMCVRYEGQMKGLKGDRLMSRQRFLGVPFPLWYRVDAGGQVNYDDIITPSGNQLPVDPSTDVPEGHTEDQHGVAGGFAGELDIMDTWVTLSLSPQPACGWLDDEDLFARTYLMDLRPQGQDIIRTWLFFTVVRANLEFGVLPWKHMGLSGWILDSDHKEVNKSKGDIVIPMGILEEHGSDAVRYWVASAHLGLDAAFDEQQIKIGRHLTIKALNASKLVLAMGGEGATVDLDPALVTVPLGRPVLAALASAIGETSAAPAVYEHSHILEVTESFFWTFYDDHLELVKERAYNRDGAWDEASATSARVALVIVIGNVVRLLAPYLSYVTEEVWSWYREDYVRVAPWPLSSDLVGAQGDPSVFQAAFSVLITLHRVKSEAKASPHTPFLTVAVRASQAQVEVLEPMKGDLEAAPKAMGALTVAASKDTEVTKASIEFFELGEAPVGRKG